MVDYAARAQDALKDVSSRVDAATKALDALEALLASVLDALTAGKEPDAADVQNAAVKLNDALNELGQIVIHSARLRTNLAALNADLTNVEVLESLDGKPLKDAKRPDEQLEAVERCKQALQNARPLLTTISVQIQGKQSQENEAKQLIDSRTLPDKRDQIMGIARRSRCPLHPSCTYVLLDVHEGTRVSHGVGGAWITTIPKSPTLSIGVVRNILKALATGTYQK